MLGEKLGIQAQQAGALQAGGTPVWTTAYAGGNFTDNDFGNNTGAPSMQATLNDPHAAILAPPVTPPPPAVVPLQAPPPGVVGRRGGTTGDNRADVGLGAGNNGGGDVALPGRMAGFQTPVAPPTAAAFEAAAAMAATAKPPPVMASRMGASTGSSDYAQTLRTSLSRTPNTVLTRSSMTV